MGTYTTNYNLFLPTIGEQGWGALVNGNFSTIDSTMKSLSNSIGTLETEADEFDSRITTLEGAFDFDENGDIESINGLIIAVTATTTDQGLGVIMTNDTYEYQNPMDAEAYEKWRDSYLKDAEVVQIPLLRLTKENIESITGSSIKIE